MPEELLGFCGTCRYGITRGICRRYPPTMVPYPNDNQGNATYWPVAHYPGVDAETDWCGEWRRQP